MAHAPRTTDGPPGARPPAPRQPGWAYASVIAIVIAAIVIVAASRAGRPSTRDDDPYQHCDDVELRRVVTAVSVLIQTPDARQEPAIAALEAVAPRSPCAGDLRDACTTTFRGMFDAQRLVAAQQAAIDGGLAGPGDRARFIEMNERAMRLITAARQTHERCITLYEDATTRLGIAPARRGP